MRFSAIAMLVLLTTNAFASDLTCILVSGKGPFDTFRLGLPRSIPDINVGDTAALSGQLNPASGSLDFMTSFTWTAQVVKNHWGERAFWLNIGHQDWAFMRVHVNQDSDSATSYIQYSSDAVSLDAFYRCVPKL